MTNVPFINSITNELSKRKLKSEVVANAILDIAVGNDRLDNLIANGVTHSDLESLTIGGLTTEQTGALTAAYNSKDAIAKINGLESSASEIDGSVKKTTVAPNGVTAKGVDIVDFSTLNGVTFSPVESSIVYSVVNKSFFWWR